MSARHINGPLARQYRPEQASVNLSGLRDVMRVLGGYEQPPEPRGPDEETLASRYVGEAAWCIGGGGWMASRDRFLPTKYATRCGGQFGTMLGPELDECVPSHQRQAPLVRRHRFHTRRGDVPHMRRNRTRPVVRRLPPHPGL